MDEVNAANALPLLEVGTTFSNAFSLMRAHPLTVFGLSFLVGALPLRLIDYGISLAWTGPTSAAIGGIASLAAMIFQVVLGGLLVGTALTMADGEQLSRQSRGFRRLGALIAAGFLYTIGAIIGLMLLVVPYFFMIIRWAVVGSVVGAEDLGVNAAFGRSSALTKGARLRILGLQVLAGLIGGGFSLLITLLILPMLGGSEASADFVAQPIVIAFRALAETVSMGFYGALQCALYIQLRERHDGPITDRLGEIFA